MKLKVKVALTIVMYLKKINSLYDENFSCLDNILSECNAEINRECFTNLNNNPYYYQLNSQKCFTDLKRGKSDTLDNIFSDSFIEAPTIFYQFLANIYTIIVKHGISDDVFNFILFSPLIILSRKAKNDIIVNHL